MADVRITIDNVSKILKILGLYSQHEVKGQGWHRVYIHVPQPDGIPISLGRVMFQHGLFQWVKWYCPPDSGAIIPVDEYWFKWHIYVRTGRKMSTSGWEWLRLRAGYLAREHRHELEMNRINLNNRRRAQGKKPRTGAIPVVNARAAARKIMSERLSKELNTEVKLHAI